MSMVWPLSFRMELDDPDGAQLRRLHCWLLPPLQVQMMIFVPFAVAAPLASTHLPDCTPVMVPLELTFHCWLA